MAMHAGERMTTEAGGPSPMITRSRVIMMDSSYVPGRTWISAPGGAPWTAPRIVRKSAGPDGATTTGRVASVTSWPAQARRSRQRSFEGATRPAALSAPRRAPCPDHRCGSAGGHGPFGLGVRAEPVGGSDPHRSCGNVGAACHRSEGRFRDPRASSRAGPRLKPSRSGTRPGSTIAGRQIRMRRLPATAAGTRSTQVAMRIRSRPTADRSGRADRGSRLKTGRFQAAHRSPGPAGRPLSCQG
jgi:hypothetical protein